ncbi:MAG: PEP-CTERM sorting domain-containing protein [Telluria sp.]
MIPKKLLVAGAIAALSLTNAARADVIGTWDLAGATGTSLPVSMMAAGYTVTGMSAVGVSAVAFDNHFYFPGWGTTINTGKYFQMSVTHANPYVLNKMTFAAESTASTSATMYVRSSADNYASDIDSFTWASPNTEVTPGDFDFDALGTLAGTTTLRFYLTSTNANAYFGFANHQCKATGGGSGCGAADAGRDITLNGTVPEPGAFALLGIGMVGFAAARRRKKAAK